ncbi:hypothetical protein E1K68_13645 [Pseudomonas sp. B2021]|nr:MULTISPECIES: M10 family metallopeptidase C-terminal domain-containing protein [Pseudomonas]MBR7213803.1 hypothetical protein [Pseudomonas sp. B2021]
MSISLLPPTPDMHGLQQRPVSDDRQKLNDLLRAGPSGIMRRKEPDRHPSDLPRAPQASTPSNPSPSTNQKLQAPGTDAPEEQASTAPTTAPTTDVEPQAPGADAPRLAQLRALASRESITQMLREPNSQESAQKLAEIGSLLSKENVKSMLHGPDADEARKLITKVKERLGQSSLQMIHEQSSHIERPGLSPQEIRARTASSDPEESFSQSMQVLDELRVEESYAQQRVRQSTPLASALFEIGKEVDLGEPTPQPDNSSAEADSLKTASNSNDSRIGIGQTFTFHSIRDSNFDAPKEVMDFDHNRDKLDVTAIRKQLGNKPLKSVENFSGASGEVQIHYNPANNTSVVMISGNPGEPPFVVKVFGEVRYSNLTT